MSDDIFKIMRNAMRDIRFSPPSELKEADHMIYVFNVEWDDIEMPFVNPPSKLLPDIATLRIFAETGLPIRWTYKGLVGMLTLATITNAINVYDNTQMNKHRRESVPKHVGKFFWSQTLSPEEYAKHTLNAKSSTECGDKA